MRLDTLRLHARLTSAMRAVQGVRQDRPDPVPLWRLGQLLFEPPLAAVTHEVRARLARRATDVESRVAGNLLPDLTSTIQHVVENLSVLDVNSLAQNDLREARTLAAAIRDAFKSGNVAPHHREHTKDLERQVNALSANQPSSMEVARAALDSARHLREKVSATLDRMAAWGDLARNLDSAASLEQFQASCEFIASVIAGDEFPPELPPSIHEVAGYKDHALRLAEDVLVELSVRPLLHQSVLRLRIHLETFERDVLLREMREAKGSNLQNERVLQRAMDRFLFAEGLFPLTHFQLANGQVDSAFEERRAVALEQSPHLETSPALIELKQVVKLDGPGPTPAEVRKAVVEGTQQATRYRAGLGVLWPSHLVYVIVVYNGPKILLLSPHNERVLLVYLGDTTPSGSKETLEVSVGDF